MSKQGKLNREEVAVQLAKVRERDWHCQHFRELSSNSDVHMWFAPDGTCQDLGSKSEASLVFACSNHGYFTFEVEYKLEARRDLLEFSAPIEGTLLVLPPEKNEKYSFNWDFSTLTAKAQARKEDCSITWSLDEAGVLHSAMTLVDVVTS